MKKPAGLTAQQDALPPLNALRNFEVVARLGSFASAAAEMHVTHWAVGKQIRSLEDWLGVPLFERRARGVTLTDEGAALFGDVSPTLERLTDAAGRLRHEKFVRRASGSVRVNVPASFALYWLLPRLADFHRQWPDIEVRVSTTSRRLRYIGNAFDIGVRSGLEQDGSVISRSLMADLRLPVCSPGLLRQHPIREAADLRHHTLLHSTSTRTTWSQWLRAANAVHVRPAHQVEFEHAYLQLAAAAEGLGVALASLPLIENELAAGRLVCPISRPHWHAPDYTLVTNAERAGDDAVTAFEKWIVMVAAQKTAPRTTRARKARH
ncbi:MAG: LysR substrate-binding domain-containing protein [Burkholderiaceae bacterium]|jgi:DNA-binding transcriptional LysR family regulator